MMTTRLGTSILLGMFFNLAACDDPKPATEANAKNEAAENNTEAKTDEEPAEEAEAPACDKVVDTMASFSPGSGDPERKLWDMMCDEMTPEQRTCVASAKEMAGMEACMGPKGKEKLK